ncbi:glycosyltransferase family 2 protein [Pseudoclavibacter sp. AY1F1]|uniref:glycosyltransferase family 2 protein n=1 Tax=Pseudoclavibacter sp. AY1F1 TaxID=2080583 RepID=UPI001CA5D43F|nr:glycosyltransferase [Pseudoclavibacter sp. AY1F1]
MPGNRWDLVDSREATESASARSVSVIVAHFEQQTELDRTLAALARQTHPAHLLEVIVVDDGSREPPVVPSGVRLLVQENLGFRAGAARNLGARNATGEILCFLDADTSPEPEYVTRMAALPSVLPEAVVAGHRKHADFAGVDAQAPVEVAGPARELPEPAWLAAAYRDSGNLLEADNRSYRFVIGAVFSCTRWFFAETAGFDEDFLGYGGEDWEWSHRAWLAGAVLAHEPSAVAWHDGPDWAGRSAEDTNRQEQKNRETLMLAQKIGVDGSRPLALRTAATDVVVVLHSAPSAGAAFVCVDTLLAQLPHATVVVPAEVHPVFGPDQRVVPATGQLPRGRVRIDLSAAVHFGETGQAMAESESESEPEPKPKPKSEPEPESESEPSGIGESALQCAVAQVGVSDLGTVRLGPHVVVSSERALRRAERWGPKAGWRTAQGSDGSITVIPGDVSVAAHLGGWLALG